MRAACLRSMSSTRTRTRSRSATCCGSRCSSSRASRCWPSTAIRPTCTTTIRTAASSSTPRSRISRLPRTSCTCCGPTANYTELEAKVLDLSLVLQAEHGGRQQLDVHDPCRLLDRHRHLRGGLRRLSALSRARATVERTSRSCSMFEDLKSAGAQLGGRGCDRGLPQAPARQGGLRQCRSHLRPRPSRLLDLGPSHDDPARVRRDACRGEGPHRRVSSCTAASRSLGRRSIAAKRKVYKGVSANVDFYSGFVYQMLGIPEELFTPLFAVSRVVGWCAHRSRRSRAVARSSGPAYKSVAPSHGYVPLDER